MIVVEGWLVFEGERMSFSLSPRDISVPRTNLFRGQTNVIKLPLARPDLEIAILVEFLEGTVNESRSIMRNWATDSRPARGISVLPPLEPEATETQDRWEWLAVHSEWLGGKFTSAYCCAVVALGIAFGLGFTVIAFAIFILILPSAAIGNRAARRKALRQLATVKLRLENGAP